MVAALLGALLVTLVCGGVLVGRGVRGLRWREAAPLVLAVVAVTAVAAWLRASIVPHHAMFLDEPWYAEAARSILRSGKALLCEERWDGQHCAAYPKALGWPIVLSVVFSAAGPSSLAAIRSCLVLGVATVPLVAIAARLAGATRLQALLAATLLAAYPAHVTWSATAETAVPCAFFVALAIVGLLAESRSQGPAALGLVGGSICMAAAIRPEALAMIAPASVVLLAARRRHAWATALLGTVTLVAILAVVPMWRLNRQIAPGGAFLSIAHVTAAVRSLPLGILGFHGAIVVVAAASALERRSAVALAVVAAGTAQLLAGLAFHRFADRLLVPGTVALLTIAARLPGTHSDAREGSRADALVAVSFCVALLWMCRDALRDRTRAPETQVLETRLSGLVAGAVRASPDALLVTEMPATVAFASTAPVMATETALASGAGRLADVARARTVFFVCDMYCEAGFGGSSAASACPRALRDLELVPVASSREGSRQYGVYRVVGVRRGTQPIGCPTAFGR